jgi:hypothetical protein
MRCFILMKLLYSHNGINCFDAALGIGTYKYVPLSFTLVYRIISTAQEECVQNRVSSALDCSSAISQILIFFSPNLQRRYAESQFLLMAKVLWFKESPDNLDPGQLEVYTISFGQWCWPTVKRFQIYHISLKERSLRPLSLPSRSWRQHAVHNISSRTSQTK